VQAAATDDATEPSSSSVRLTKDNFAEITAGKNVFIKFFDPHCEHCQTMAPEWEKMAAEWNQKTSRTGKNHNDVLIAEVDCRASLAQERWCFDEMEIFGVPSLMYGEPSHGGEYLQSYGDDKTYRALTRFVNETLAQGPICSPGRPSHCDADTQQLIQQYWKMSQEQLTQEITAKEDAMDDARRNFKLGSNRLQTLYDETALAHETHVADQRQTIKLLQSIREARRRRQQQQQQS